MAALPYMQLYVADYLADTMHLTTEEHGAYILLIFNYWQTGKPLTANSERLSIVARMSNERWTSVEETLKEFFTVKDGKWVHPRIEADLDHVAQLQEKASAAGKASAVARKRKKQIKSNARSTDVGTDVEQTYQHGANHTDPDPNTDPDKKKTNTHLAMLVSMGVDDQIAKEWLSVRKLKKLQPTQTAFNAVNNQADIVGMTMNEAVKKAVEEGWGGFKAKWITEPRNENNNNENNPIREIL